MLFLFPGKLMFHDLFSVAFHSISLLTYHSFNDCQYYRNNINKKTLAELNALMDSEKTTLEHVELNEADLSDEIIQEFDCGNDDMNEYLYDYAREGFRFQAQCGNPGRRSCHGCGHDLHSEPGFSPTP